MKAQVTVKDVTRIAEVSVGTVSRVLRGEPNVMPETQRRVRQAAEQLNYTRLRRSSAKVAPQDQTKNVALLLLGMDRTLANLPVVADAIHGAENALAIAGVRVTLADVPNADRVPESLNRREKVHGVLAKGALQGQLIEHCSPRLKQRMRELTTIDIGAERIGRQAAHQLLWRLDHPETPNLSVAIEPRLIVGRSVGSI